MNHSINPTELQEVGNHFYRFVEYHIEQIEKDYLLGEHELPFIHYCFQRFLDHYRAVYSIKNDKN